MKYYVFADGASKGNPGESSIGGICFKDRIQNLPEFIDNGQFVFSISKRIGRKTNNEAEYLSLITALEHLKEHNIQTAEIYMDSELVVRQINGIYKVKKENLIPLWRRANELRKNMDLTFSHVPREKNQIADYLANQALK
jgi:ribonuclease HI